MKKLLKIQPQDDKDYIKMEEWWDNFSHFINAMKLNTYDYKECAEYVSKKDLIPRQWCKFNKKGEPKLTKITFPSPYDFKKSLSGKGIPMEWLDKKIEIDFTEINDVLNRAIIIENYDKEIVDFSDKLYGENKYGKY